MVRGGLRSSFQTWSRADRRRQSCGHEWLDAQGIDLHVVGGWADVFGYTLGADEGAAWSRFMNEATLEELRGQTRFLPLASVPIQSGAHAVRELEAAHAMGYRGLTVGTFAPGVELDHPDLDGLWESAARLRMPIVLHPFFLYGERRLAPHDLGNAIGRLNDTGIAVSRLLYAGVLTQHPDLRIVVVHGGGSIPYALGASLEISICVATKWRIRAWVSHVCSSILSCTIPSHCATSWSWRVSITSCSVPGPSGVRVALQAPSTVQRSAGSPPPRRIGRSVAARSSGPAGR